MVLKRLMSEIKHIWPGITAYATAFFAWVFDLFMAIPNPTIEKLTMFGTMLGVWVLFGVHIVKFKREVNKAKREESV